jgi:hypothetical protein
VAALLDIAFVFLALAVVAFLLGAKKIGGLSMEMSRMMVVVFVLLFAAAALASTAVSI